MDKLIMEFKISIKGEEITNMEGPRGSVTFIPFGGSVESELFTGEIMPGAADVQVQNPAGSRHMCAKYIFKGIDKEGNACHLFVENNGYLQECNRNDPHLNACPTFITDSPVLGEYLSQARFRTEVHGTETGVCIKVFDVMA